MNQKQVNQKILNLLRKQFGTKITLKRHWDGHIKVLYCGHLVSKLRQQGRITPSFQKMAMRQIYNKIDEVENNEMELHVESVAGTA